ncbi:immunoglobulin superfamily member 5 [Halichoeres trimaculatus]|uniref:immunoglobulin superfamily member 5 n=1 Tax=Halichoeres trimaculatus TaxID=147232 RepID=UPI003D9E5801
MGSFSLLVHLLLYWIQVEAWLKLSPQEQTVLRGEEARFTCSTSNTEWTIMTWLLNGTTVITISNEIGVLPSVNPNVTAEKMPDSKIDSWVFVLKHTERHNQGRVTCDLQGITTASGNLFVQEKGSVKVFGDKLAFKGQLVLFECHAVGWFPKPTLQWQVNNKEISQTEFNISEKSSRSLFSASSSLSVMAVQSSDVDCLASVSAMPKPLNSSIRLTVVAEVVQEDDDCTVPLAVTTSLSVLLLLLLLCICAVHWYRQRRQAKPGPQEEMRAPQMGPWRFDHSWSTSSVAEGRGGNINFGFTSEGPTEEVCNEVFLETQSHTDFTSFHKVPDVVSPSTLALHPESNDECLSEKSSKNSRMITTV